MQLTRPYASVRKELAHTGSGPASSISGAVRAKIEPASRDDVLAVALAMRERDYQELLATSAVNSRAELAHVLAARYGDRSDVLVGRANGAPVCIGGTIAPWPGVISLLFFATPEFPKIGLTITRWISKDLFPRYFDAGVRRIQATSLDGYDEVHRWLAALGLEREAVLPAFGRNGEDFVQFAKVKR